MIRDFPDKRKDVKRRMAMRFLVTIYMIFFAVAFIEVGYMILLRSVI